MGKIDLIKGKPLAAVRRAVLMAALIFVGAAVGAAQAAYDKPVYGFAMYGEPQLPEGFKHLPYVNPAAPKGGTLKMFALGTFDTFNPFILKGDPAPGMGPLVQHDLAPVVPAPVFESLATYNRDEPFTMYGLIAETIEVPTDRSSVKFTLRKAARFQDGSPITVDDVMFSFNTLKEKGHPLYKSYYASVAKVEKTGARSVTFRFVSANQKELPLILGELPILSKAYWAKRDITQNTLEPPLGSGPYKVSKFEVGRYVVFERVKDYWGKDLPVNVGRYNFDTIKVDYFRDEIPAFEAFKAGQYDVRSENSAKRWVTEYEFPALKRGEVKREKIALGRTNGLQGLFFNTRRPIFQDRRVRAALTNGFDFEWTNKIIAYGEYTHTRSYFNNTDLESKGMPQGPELQLLGPFRGKIPNDVFTTEYNPPSTSHHTIRDNLHDAQQLLAAAGWKVAKDGKLRDAAGKAFTFEILNYSSDYERILLPFVANLKLLGIEANIRTVDMSQFVNRGNSFDYDMIAASVGQSDSPGNEQRDQWSAASASEPGSSNYAGVRDPAIDAIIKGLVVADTREDLVAHVHALDRLLQWGHYAVPFWYLPAIRLAYWTKLKHPDRSPVQGPAFSTWWIEPAVGAKPPQAVAPKP